jgi:hypothetical protein
MMPPASRPGPAARRALRPTEIPEDLPGADLVAEGTRDLAAGVRSPAALLVAQAATRLRTAGVRVPDHAIVAPERDLYMLLERGDPRGAYSTYNALRRRLVSFCEAAEHYARRRER